MSALALDPDQLLTTTRTVRKRLDFDREVPAALIEECIEVAIQAPTGSLRQSWRWLVIGDQATKDAVAEVYRDSWFGHPKPSYDTSDPRGARLQRTLESANYLAEHLHRSPWLVIPCGVGRDLTTTSAEGQMRFWGSILPAMWSFMLAARGRGLGCAWTTEHLKQDERVAAILGIPHPEVTQCGLLAVAYSIGTDFKRAHRIPGSELTYWNKWS